MLAILRKRQLIVIEGRTIIDLSGHRRVVDLFNYCKKLKYKYASSFYNITENF